VRATLFGTAASPPALLATRTGPEARSITASGHTRLAPGLPPSPLRKSRQRGHRCGPVPPMRLPTQAGPEGIRFDVTMGARVLLLPREDT
jgi:hypothetical protein